MKRISKSKECSILCLILLVVTVLAAGCGGGGGSSSNNGPSTTYSGKTTQAQITQGNSETLTKTGSSSGQLSSSAGSSNAAAKPLLHSSKSALAAVSFAPETLAGNCGGTAVSDTTYDAATGAISGSTTYSSYCQDGSTENGQTSFSGTFDAATSVLNVSITFTNYAVKDTTSDTLMNGTAAVTGLVASGKLIDPTMIMNVDTRDNIGNMVLRMENLNISVVETVGYVEFTINSGRVYHPDHGYFDLSTPTAIRIYVGDENPSSGILVITGSSNTKGRLTYLSNTLYIVEVDETGSGTYSGVSGAPKNELVSRSTDSTVTGTNTTSGFPVISSDGRYVAFVSYTANLAAGATGANRQIFVHDRLTHQTELVSATSAGAEGNNESFAPAISSDGRYVAFESYSSNLANGDANGVRDVYIRDRQTQTTSRVSISWDGIDPTAESYQPSISANGRYVAFTSYADNLTPAGVTGTAKSNVFLTDLQAGATTLVSDIGGGSGGTQSSDNPAISADGTRIAFWSYESNLVAGDANGLWDIFLYDSAATPNIKLVSVSSTGVQKNQGNESISRIVAPAISADGNFVAFSTTADNLVAGDTNALQDVFVHNVTTGVTIRASEGTGGVEANGDSPVGQGERVALSADGTWLAFTSAAANISSGGSNVMIHNNLTCETTAITASSTSFSGSKGPAISGDGRYVAFMSGLQLDPRFASSGVFVQDRNLP